MFSVLYLVLCTAFGLTLLDAVIPGLKDMGRETYDHRELGIAAPVIMLPASWLTGTIFHTWLVYIMAFIVAKIKPGIRTPLTPANIAAAAVTIVIGGLLYIFVIRKREKTQPVKYTFTWHIFLLIPLTLFLCLHFYRTFHYEGSDLKIGLSVFSDFATHIGMIRSFSFGNNIPAQYSHFTGTDIRYHFMFQFLSGNLEYLGLRIDHAFNVASILSMLSACTLLYVYAVKLIGKRIAGMLTVIFMIFHSSPSLLRYLAESSAGNIFKELYNRTEFFAYTLREDWGLWNFKVYMNQRHLAFALAITFLALIIFTPLVMEMQEKLKACTNGDEKLREFLTSQDGWLPKDILKTVGLGLLLGAMAFWNGAMLIGCLSIMFVMAFFSKRRLEYLITAVIAVILSFIQTSVFIDGSAMNLEFRFGFLADNPNIFGALKYLVDLAWPLPVLVVACIFVQKGYIRLQTLAFTAPLIIAFTLSMVPELAVNHKYVMLSFILFGIPVSGLLCCMWNSRISGRIAAVVLCILLTCTGIVECRILWNLDVDAFRYSDNDPLISWIHENSDSHDIWLTPMYHISRPVVGGAMLYYGWPYYSWGAGYDTYAREEKVIRMYGAEDVNTLKALTAQEGIDYIIVDSDARSQFEVNEDIIAAAFPVAYTEDEGDWRLTVYKVE